MKKIFDSTQSDSSPINELDLSAIVNIYPIEIIESALIKIFLLKNKIKTNNLHINKILKKCNEIALKDINNFLSSKKIDLDLHSIVKLFELLHTDTEKRQSGTFYTPSFVVDFIAKNTIKYDSKVIDISCGCGAFLIGAIKQLESVTRKKRIYLIEHNIFGVDISSVAIERAKSILILFALLGGEDKEEVHFNLWSSDSLEFSFQQVLERESLNGGFDVVIGNPPYSKLSNNYNLENVKSKFITCADNLSGPNLYVLFAELMISIVDKNKGSLGMILPLSLAYSSNKSIKILREIIHKSNADWFFSFYDRSPDSLFGDSVKTRNSIVIARFNKNNNNSIASTKLIRWNSKIRNSLFKKLEYQNLYNLQIEKYIPKISTRVEFNTLELLLASSNRFNEYLRPPALNIMKEKFILHYYPTAYNWLPVFIELPGRNVSNSSDNAKKITLMSLQQVEVAYSILNSRLVYWLWLVIGDGFHVTENFISEIPFNPNKFSQKAIKRLQELGHKLWSKSQNFPIVKLNKGKSVYNFNMLRCVKMIEEIDKIILLELSIPFEFNNFLNKRYLEHVSAGRSEYKNMVHLIGN